MPSPLDGRYVIEHQLGTGAVGTVFRAYDLERGENVALKVWREAPENPKNPAVEEARLLSRMAHPSIVGVFDAGLSPTLGVPYLALEWLDGGDLRMRHWTSPLSIEQIVCLGILLCEALEHAHQAGFVHGDLKPENILFKNATPGDERAGALGGLPVLSDFGLAGESRAKNRHVGGTPAYMAPEQVRSDATLDERTDLYALGATLFELLVGRPPHVGATPLSTLARLATTPAPRVSVFRPDVSRRLDSTLAEFLATDPEERPRDATEAKRLLERCLSDELSLPAPEEAPLGERPKSAASRLVTTLVVLGLGGPTPSEAAVVETFRAKGVPAVSLGGGCFVAHLGVDQATGGEASLALSLARTLAESGASVGIATGRARLSVSRRSSKAQPVGEVVDRAAALAREARASEILVDATTSELGRANYEFRVRDDGSAYVGGVSSGRPSGAGGAPFVGREVELSQILGAFERARVESLSTIVAIGGPPGIGKSRLMREAVARLSSLGEPPRVVVQRSDAYGARQVLGAAADFVRGLLGLRKGTSAEDAERALLDGLGPETLSEVSRENRNRLVRLLASDEGFAEESKDALTTRDHLWLAMTDLVNRVLSNETVLLVVEDVQWADGESVAFFEHLLGRGTKRPLVILACLRPIFWQEHPQSFVGKNLVRLDLRPIARKSVRAIAEAVLGRHATPDNVELIADQAAGSPLFAEELSRIHASGRGASLAPTIEAAIQVSLDALDPKAQDALRRASVLGLATWPEALAALGVEGADEALRELAARELLVRQSSSRFEGTIEYLFKHALVRDVAYSTLGPEETTELHALAGSWLAQVGEDAATVAGHLERGRDYTLAAEFWERAARRALVANALPDALTMADKALAYADDQRIAFRRAQLLDEAHARLDPRAADRAAAISAMAENAFDEASELLAEGASARYDDARGQGMDVDERLEEVRRRATSLGLVEEIAKTTACLAQRRAFAGDFIEAEREVERLLELAGNELRAARVDAFQSLAVVKQSRGAVAGALDARKSAVQAAREAGLRERESMLTTNLGFALSTIGARTEAREAIERGAFIAEAIGSPAALRHAQMNLLGWASVYGTDKRVDALLGETRAEADATASGHWAAPDRSNLGVLYYRGIELLRSATDSGRTRARSLLRLAAENYRSLGHRDVLPVALGMWAEAERLNRDPERSVELASEAVSLLAGGAPSLLNETPIYLTLFKALVDLGRDREAQLTLERSVAPLLRRVQGLLGSPYARGFLTELPYNTELVAILETSGLLPESLHRLLEERSPIS